MWNYLLGGHSSSVLKGRERREDVGAEWNKVFLFVWELQ